MQSEIDTIKQRLYIDNRVQNFKPFAGSNADASSEDMAREINGFFASVEENTSRRFSIRKINHRLHILDGDSVCYSPPNFLQLPNRAALQTLVDAFNAKNSRCIDASVDFEAKYRGKRTRKNP